MARKIVITSGKGGVGKTTILANLGIYLSKQGYRVALIDAVSWTPAVLGALMVPVMFFLGKKLGDWKTGLLAGLFIAVIGGQFFARSICSKPCFKYPS